MVEKHRRRSIRLPGYDYTRPGAYYITIVTFKRACWFGEIANGEMKLSKVGQIVRREWLRLPSRFPNVELDEFIVMPDHLHGIIVIVDSRRRGTGDLSTAKVKATTPVPLPAGENFGGPVPGSIPTIIRSFKAAVSFRINSLVRKTAQSVWQRNYYEHLIRDEIEWNSIRLYIQSNPINWELDNENPAVKKI